MGKRCEKLDAISFYFELRASFKEIGLKMEYDEEGQYFDIEGSGVSFDNLDYVESYLIGFRDGLRRAEHKREE